MPETESIEEPAPLPARELRVLAESINFDDEDGQHVIPVGVRRKGDKMVQAHPDAFSPFIIVTDDDEPLRKVEVYAVGASQLDGDYTDRVAMRLVVPTPGFLRW